MSTGLRNPAAMPPVLVNSATPSEARRKFVEGAPNEVMPYLRYTITVDASDDHERQRVGIGIIVQESRQRGCRGVVIEEVMEPAPGIKVGEGEKYAVLRALEVAVQWGFRDVKIRSDYNAVRRKLRENYRCGECRDPGALDERILSLARRFERVHFAWVAKRKNQRAHQLARRARNLFKPP